MGRGWRATANTLHREIVGRRMADRLNGATPFVRLMLHHTVHSSPVANWNISLPIHEETEISTCISSQHFFPLDMDVN